MQARTPRYAIVIGAAALALSACGDDGNDTAAEPAAAAAADAVDEMAADEMAEPTIVDVAASTEDFSTLVAAVQAAGLVDTLNGDGPFTVFAPTNEAFAAALESLDLTAEELLSDTETLTSILTYHVVAGEVPSSVVVGLDGEAVETVNGSTIAVALDGDSVMINDVTVTAVDVAASNGVIHVIDGVLLPPAGG